MCEVNSRINNISIFADYYFYSEILNKNIRDRLRFDANP